jgi:hypothetical protein
MSNDLHVHAPSAAPSWRQALPWLLIFGAGCALYLATAQRGVGWSDTGFVQWRILNRDFTGSMGLAQAHPACIGAGWLAWWLPVGNPWWRINACGAPLLAVALANVALLVRLATGRWGAGVAAAALLGASHLAWFQATSAETYYAFSAALLTTELLLLLRLARQPHWRWLSLLGLTAGLHWSCHNFALLALPVYAVVAVRLVIRRRLPVWAPIPALVLFLAGALPVLVLTAQRAAACGSWTAATRDLLFGNFAAAVCGLTGRLTWFRLNAAMFALNFWNPLWLCALPGVAALWRLPERLPMRAILAVLALHAFFLARYTVIDQATFALPTLTLLAVAAGLGIEALRRRAAAWRWLVPAALVLACLAPAAYLAMNAAAHRFNLFPARSRELPFRDEARTWILPWKHDDRAAACFATAALAQVEPGAVIVADWTASFPLLLTQRYGGCRGDVTILSQEAAGAAQRERVVPGERPLYVVSAVPGYAPAHLLDGSCTFTPTGVLVRVQAAAPPR